MHWFIELFARESVAHSVVLIGIVAATGLMLGSIKIKGISLGIAGVLFSGLIVGHFYAGWPQPENASEFQGGLNKDVLHVLREFGLILFVYTIGVQVGPGFFSSLRKQGLPLNIMAASIVIGGAVITMGIRYVGNIDTAAAVGLYSGATTNTPSLGAAQEALRNKMGIKAGEKPTAEQSELINKPGLGYAVAYPFGIIGIILTMLLIRTVGKVDTAKEAEVFAALGARRDKALSTMNIEVKNANLHGRRIVDIPALPESGVVISRVSKGGQTIVAKRDTVVELGDIVLAVGRKEDLEKIRTVIGIESSVDLRTMPSAIITRRIVVTKSQVLGKTVADLELASRFGVMITRLSRSEVELPPTGTRLNFGDTCLAVGEADAVKAVATLLGDEVKALTHPRVIPIFVGIVLGVIVGSWPLDLGLPAPVKLGLAGGPLVVAILLARLGHIGPLVWHLPASANLAIREIGIVLFLACVGLASGDRFIPTLTQGEGLYWMALASLITAVPLLVVGCVARFVYKINFLTLCGVLAGSMTDPPALAFANTVSNSDAPSVSYATVYPLTMLLRVLSAQTLVLLM